LRFVCYLFIRQVRLDSSTGSVYDEPIHDEKCAMKRFQSTGCAFALALVLAAIAMEGAPAPADARALTTRSSCPKASASLMVSQAQAIRAIVCASASRRVVIVGEIHGSNEVPALVGALVKSVAATSRPVRLGLEMQASEQGALETYLHSSGTAADRAQLLRRPFWSMRDGRSSRAMLRLIDGVRALRERGADVDAFAMEPDYGDSAAMARAGGMMVVKEAGMAQAVRGTLVNPQAQTLVIALMGNFHARYGKDSPVGSAPTPSLTERLADVAPYVVLPFARQGNTWNCQSDGCKVHAFSSSHGPKGRLPRFVDGITTPSGPSVVELWLQKMTPALPALPALPAKSVLQKGR
jgi:hypothetical protein